MLKTFTILGNTLFILWILYNGIDERGQGIHVIQAVALASLVILLILNIYLLSRRNS